MCSSASAVGITLPLEGITISTRNDCQALNAADALAALRDQFYLPDDGICLDDNSTGAPAKTALAPAPAVIAQQWEPPPSTVGTRALVNLPARLGGKLVPLIGTNADEVVATDSTSINLFKVSTAALHSWMSGTSRTIYIENRTLKHEQPHTSTG